MDSSKKLARLRPLTYLLIFFALFFSIAWLMRIQLTNKYRSAIEELYNGQYQSGIDHLKELGDYQDSLIYIERGEHRLAFDKAVELFNQGKYDAAGDVFEEIKDADILNVTDGKNPNWYISEIERMNQEQIDKEKEQTAKEKLYNDAYKYFEEEKYLEALLLFHKLGTFKDSESIFQQCLDRVNRLKYSTTISAGTSSSAGVKSDGTVYLCGERVLRPSDVAEWTDIISVSTMGSLVIGLKMDGSVVTAGSLDNNYHIETGNWDDIIAVSAGDLYVVGLRSNGTLVAQGYNTHGQLNISDWRDITSISTGWRLTVGLDKDGNIYVAGRNEEKILEDINNNIDDWSNIVAISAGGGTTTGIGERGHIVALKADHTAVAAGDNGRGQCNVTGSEWSDLVAVSAGAFHTVGLRADGTVVTTQTDETIINEIKKWNEDKDIIAVSAGYGFTIGLKSDGHIVGSGFFYDKIRDTDDWEDIAYCLEEWRSIFNNEDLNKKAN